MSDDSDVAEIRAEDLRIDVERRPSGVQPVKIYSGVRIEHLPTGLIAFCGTEKSQLRNKQIALIMLRAGLETR
jgi:peptide chain release factor 2